MPCRDWQDERDYGEDLRAQNDKLARIACKELQHIEESGDGLEILILKDPEVQEWWTAHKEADRRAAEQREAQRRAKAEKDRLSRIKAETLTQLSSDQKKALGIK